PTSPPQERDNICCLRSFCPCRVCTSCRRFCRICHLLLIEDILRACVCRRLVRFREGAIPGIRRLYGSFNRFGLRLYGVGFLLCLQVVGGLPQLLIHLLHIGA